MSTTSPGRTVPERIAYVHQYFATPSMPGGTRSYEMARRLVARGHEVHVITTDTAARRGSGRWRTSVEGGATVHWLPVPYRNAMGNGRRSAAFVHFMAAATARAWSVAPDVVLASSTPLTVAVPGGLAAGLRRARFVFEVRDLWPELPVEVGALRNPVSRQLARLLADTAYRRADHVVALSPGMADGVARRGCPRSKISVVPNASDRELFSCPPEEARRFRAERPWLGDRPLLVYAGTFGAVNGVDWLVRLAAEAARTDPELRLLLVGGGREHTAVAELARSTGVLGRSVFMEPELPKDAVPRVLAAATAVSSVFCVPGMRDNSANKFFDGLAAGRPVVINHLGWQADLLRSSGAGLVLDRDDLPGSARLLVERLRDERWLASARRESARLARERFDRDLLFEEFHAAVVGRDRGATAHGGRGADRAAV